MSIEKIHASRWGSETQCGIQSIDIALADKYVTCFDCRQALGLRLGGETPEITLPLQERVKEKKK